MILRFDCLKCEFILGNFNARITDYIANKRVEQTASAKRSDYKSLLNVATKWGKIKNCERSSLSRMVPSNEDIIIFPSLCS